MEQTKDYGDQYYHGETVVDQPPSYTSGPSQSSYGPPQHYPQSYTTSVAMVHAPMAVVGTQVGVVGTQVGMVGTQVGMVGTQVGVVGVGHGTVPVLIQQQISPKPTRLTCKSCNSDITTRVESKPTWKTHFFAGLLCFMGCWCCVCIPYCTDSCLNNDHYCPNCNAYIGSYIT